MAMKDVAASERLRREVRSQYEAHHKARFTKTGLAVATGRVRPTLDNWLEKGQMPDAEGMADLAKGVGVQPAQLWVKWLDLATSDPLVRIADALDRAYPPEPRSTNEVTVVDGPPLPAAGSPVESSVQEGLRQDRLSQQPEGPDKPGTSPARPPRGTGAGRG